MEEQQKTLEEQLSDCQLKMEEYLLGWQRERADFANYKKDEAKMREESRFYIKSKIIYEFLIVLDNFDMALKHMPEDLKSNNWIMGVSHIRQQLEIILKGEGAEEIKCIGEKFDPVMHEALEEVEMTGEGKEPAFASAAAKAMADKKAMAGKSGVILEELQKGYRLDGRVIRPAKVKISK